MKLTLQELINTTNPPNRKPHFPNEMVPIYDNEIGLITSHCFQWHEEIKDWAIVSSEDALARCKKGEGNEDFL